MVSNNFENLTNVRDLEVVQVQHFTRSRSLIFVAVRQYDIVGLGLRQAGTKVPTLVTFDCVRSGIVRWSRSFLST